MNLVGLVLAGLGTVMIFLAATGLLRFPDIYTRSHAAGKAATLGVCTILLGTALGLSTLGAWVRALVSVAFLFVTIPVGTQLVARAALRYGADPSSETRIDAGFRMKDRRNGSQTPGASRSGRGVDSTPDE